MKSVSLAAILALVLTPAAARADGLCDQLGKAIDLARTGFGPVEGDPLPGSNDGQYWRSTIQLSSGDNCAIEGHRILSCSWEPSTAADMQKMVGAIAACFPNAPRTEAKIDPDGPPDTTFKFDQASIEVGLTVDVLSINVGP
ncbi:MAG: hypothetical protein P4L73_17315 [Caulobacteraceae bacterium]|nr:hypothetical protein [Caulobacteraceae bacterium]